MNMPAPLTIAARRAMVEELRRRQPDISARQIAARLGVGKDAVRRDIGAIEAEQRQRAAVVAAAAAPSAPDPTPTAPHGDTVVLQLDEPLRQRRRAGAAPPRLRRCPGGPRPCRPPAEQRFAWR
ncbi:helix-turn-helix domain-containing protein [Streptomyces sp. IBSBF 2953]|nr:helix-turn-helix domain-containing protein [Streptomyces hayashii]